MHPYIPDFIKDKFQSKQFSGSFQSICMFCDISGFTSLTEQLLKHGKYGSEVLTTSLRYIFNPMVDSVYSHLGFISTFGGDAFNAVFIIKDQEEKAAIFQHTLSSAREILDFFKSSGFIKTELGDFSFDVKIGISSGNVEWGIIGEEDSYGYYFKGEAIDKAALLEHVTEKGEFTLSDELKLFEQKEISREMYVYEKNDIPDKILTSFLPDEFLNWEGGEFRHVVSVFLPFETDFTFPQLNTLYKITNSIIKKYEGFLSRLSFGDKGAMFLVFFGFPVCHEDDVKRSFIFMDEWKKETNKAVKDLHFNMGVSFGLTYAGISGGENRSELTCLGDVVNFAARLAFAQERDEIYLSKEISDRAASFAETALAFHKKFKGKTGELPVYKFISLKKQKTVKRYSIPLIGRDEEFKLIKSMLEESIFKGKNGGVLILNGDPGIGKTRLIYEIRENIVISGLNHRWITLSCDNLISKSWNGLDLYLKKYFGINEADEMIDRRNFMNGIEKLQKAHLVNRELRNEIQRTHSFVANELNITLKNSLFNEIKDSKMRHENLISGYKAILKAMSTVNPLIIEIEDGQWMDESVKKLLTRLSLNVDKYPFMIIITSRFNKAMEKVDFSFMETKKVTQIDLKPLSNKEELFCNLILGEGRLSDGLRNFLTEKSNGNPFFIEQWLKHLNDTSAVEKVNDEWLLTEKVYDLPSEIDQVIIARIDSLGIQVKEILQRASILGKRFALMILREMVSREVQMEECLLKARGSNILIQEESLEVMAEIMYFFTHAIFKDVAYEMQLKERRMKLHKLAFETIENLFKDDLQSWYDDLCVHAENANMNNELINYLEKAGDYNTEIYRNDIAISQYNKLVSQDIDISRKIRIFNKIGNIYKITGPYFKAEESYRKALEYAENIDNQSIIAETRENLASILCFQGKNDESQAILEDLEKTYDKVNLSQRRIFSNKLLGNIYFRKGEYEKSLKHFNFSIDLSRKEKIKDDIETLYLNTGVIYYCLGDLKKSIYYFKQSGKIASSNGNLMVECKVLGNIAVLYKNKSMIKKALFYSDRTLEIGKKIGDNAIVANTLNNIANIYHLSKDYRNAIKLYEESIEIKREVGDIYGIAISISNIGLTYILLEKYDKAIRYLKKSLDISLKTGDQDQQIFCYLGIGRCYLRLKKTKIAERTLKEGLVLSRNLKKDSDTAHILVSLGDIEIIKKNIVQADILYEEGLDMLRKQKDDKDLTEKILEYCEFTMDNIEPASWNCKKMLEMLSEAKVVASKPKFKEILTRIESTEKAIKKVSKK